MPGYCESAPGHPFHGPYHDDEYGFPTTDDTVLFERLVLEINQAGLSWLTILKKRDAFRKAFDGFDPHLERRPLRVFLEAVDAHHHFAPAQSRI